MTISTLMTIQPSRAWWFQKFVGSWQINGFWAWRQFVDSPLIPWGFCVLGNISLNVGESKCSSSGRRSLARRGPSVVFSTGRRRFFYRCLKYLPGLVKTRALQKANVSFLPFHVFWKLKTNFCFLREPCLACFCIFWWKLECQGPCWCKLSQNGPRQVSDLSENESKPTSTRFSPFLWPSFIFIPLSTNKEMKVRNSSQRFFSLFSFIKCTSEE